VILGTGDFDRTETCQMIGQELGVEQGKIRNLQPVNEIGQSDLRSVAPTRKHAFTEEGATKRYAVDAPDQIAVRPDFQ